ncbi:hypothetical protein D9619_008139 [Psilocybe cf. subviscida]|uniref:Transmembrane protein n=1 Tax=Psilocybe cf. subviscida TaxID=2480587 RepID=A0A8H5ATG1_9AGAR|nr:hypothetical protein D9619_008139 [Psilocybe cf. subviscida]
MSLSLIVDDAALPQSAFAGGQWDHQNGQNSFLDGTVTTHRGQGNGGRGSDDDDDDDQPPPNLTYSFFGSDVSVYGTLTPGLAMNFSIDGSTSAPAQFNNGSLGKPGVEIFSITGLGKTEQHKLQLFPTTGQFVFDYFASTATASTNLTSSDLLIDDHSSLVHYSSTGWTRATNVEYPTGSPFLRTASGSSTPGSSLTFSFTGSSISVIGATQKANGTLTASFTVDGQNPVTFNPFDGSQNVNASQWTVSQTLFHQEVAPGPHQLTVTLDAVTGSQVLWIDSFVFKGTNQTVLPTSTPGVPSGGRSSKKLSGGAIAGILISLLVAFALLGVFIWRWRGRGRRRYQKSKVIIDLNDTHPKVENPAVVMEEIPKMDQFMHARVQAAYRAARQHQTQQHHQDPSFDTNEYPINDEESSALPHHSHFDSAARDAHFTNQEVNNAVATHATFPTASQEKAHRKDTVLQWTQPTVRNQSEDIAPSVAHEIVATAALLAPAIAPVTPHAHDIPPALMPGRTRSSRDAETNGNLAHHGAYSFSSSTIPPPAYDFAGSSSHKPA